MNDSLRDEHVGAEGLTAKQVRESIAAQLNAVMAHQMLLREAQNDENRRSRELQWNTSLTSLLLDRKTAVGGSMVWTPVALGSVEGDESEVSGTSNLSQVPGGEYHLILDCAVTGVTRVTVSRTLGSASIANAV